MTITHNDVIGTIVSDVGLIGAVRRRFGIDFAAEEPGNLALVVDESGLDQARPMLRGYLRGCLSRASRISRANS
jgi:hypothetical protein